MSFHKVQFQKRERGRRSSYHLLSFLLPPSSVFLLLVEVELSALGLFVVQRLAEPLGLGAKVGQGLDLLVHHVLQLLAIS